ncbi:MFS transporter [Paenibacillus sp. Marseille-Q4541]|uniref:MFS transporter n=1 Tax=Paenibacillus sp. Marseille-Q4541 TaxID=2831522 RepID=UPI001BA800BD|nr:MFS transporter [Paenibacillus sp. Marseille-Q4541]
MQTSFSTHQNVPKNDRFPVALICLTIGAFAIGMTEFVIMGILPNVASDLNVTIPQAGQLITGYALGVAIGAPVLTMLTNRIAQKPLLCMLMAIFIIGNLVGAIAPTYGLLMGSRLVTALAHGTFLGTGSLIATQLVRPEKRAGAVSMVLAGLTISNIIGVPFGTLIGQNMGWRASFVAITIMGIISLIGIIFLIPKIEQSAPTSLYKEVRSLFNPQVLLVLATGAFGACSMFTVFTYITPLLTDITGFQEQSVTWILVMYGIGVTLGNIIGGRLADWKLMPSMIAIFSILAALLFVLSGVLHSPSLTLICVFLWGAAAFGIMPGIQLRIMNLAHEAPRLAATSSHSALNIGNAAGAFIGGLVITHAGLVYVPMIGGLMAAVGIGGAILSYYNVEKRKTAAAK